MDYVRTVAVMATALYLLVRPTGSRSWVQRLVIRGQRRDLGLGGFPLVSLKEAREEAFANRKLARAAGDPLAEKHRANGMLTFAAAAERVWNDKNPGWRHPQHAQDWMSSLTRYVLPHIGKMPVSQVTSADVLDTLRRIWHVRPATARRVRQAHRCRDGLGHRNAASDEQPLRPARAGTRPPTGSRAAHAGIAPRRGSRGDPDGVGLGSDNGRQAGV